MLKQPETPETQLTLGTLSERDCFLFDLDGTLVDSSSSHENAFLKAITQLRPELAENFSYARVKGLKTDEVFRDLGLAHEPELVKLLTETKQKLYRQEIEAGTVQPIDCALELLEYLKSTKRRIFLVTSASRKSVEAILAKLNVRHFFEGVVTGDEVVRAKPDPQCYLQCLATWSIEDKQAIVIEDAIAGVEAAKAANLLVLAVNNADLESFDGYVGTLQMLLVTITALDEFRCESVL